MLWWGYPSWGICHSSQNELFHQLPRPPPNVTFENVPSSHHPYHDPDNKLLTVYCWSSPLLLNLQLLNRFYKSTTWTWKFSSATAPSQTCHLKPLVEKVVTQQLHDHLQSHLYEMLRSGFRLSHSHGLWCKVSQGTAIYQTVEACCNPFNNAWQTQRWTSWPTFLDMI